MDKQEIRFAVATKGSTVVKIGRSQIIQPQIMYKGNGIQWFDDSKLKKGNTAEKVNTEAGKDM